MLAQDVTPTRFRRAVFKARDMVQSQVDGETALVAFAGAAFVVSPLTDDRQTLLNFLDSLNPGIMPVQGSRVDLSLSVAQKILHASSAQNGKIYVLTDGASQLEDARQQAEEIRKNGHAVSVLAFGTEQGGPIKDNSGTLARDEQGQLIIAKVFFDDLQSIARAGGGRFAKMTASDDDIGYLLSGTASSSVDASVDSADRTLERPLNDGIWLVWLGLPFALLLFRKNALWALVLISVIPFDRQAYAFDWQALWKNPEQRAYDAYQRGEYDDSNSLSGNPLLKGSAYYRQQEYENAQSWFARQGDADSYYNLGNALAHLQQFHEAVAAYGSALEIDPEFDEARHNKKLIEEYIKQQQEQQARQPDQNDKGEQSDDESADQSESNQSESQQPGQPRGSNDDELQSDSVAEQRQQQNQVDPQQPAEEELAGNEQFQEQQQAPESIDRWINRLPDDPSELLRRKFLRDYQRQWSQP